MAREQRVQGVAQNKRLYKTDHHCRHAWKIPNATMANATGIQFWKRTPRNVVSPSSQRAT